MKYLATIFILFLFLSCRTSFSGSFIFKYAKGYEEINFITEQSLLYNLRSDSEVITTNCDYTLKRDSLFIISSLQQDHVKHLTIIDTFIIGKKNTLVQIPSRRVFMKTGGFVSLAD
jgi:hypothetical protein